MPPRHREHAARLEPAEPNIRQVLDEFLEAQRRRLKPRTVSKYEHIVELLEHHLDDYAVADLDERERALLHAAEARQPDAPPRYCDLFGPDRIPAQVGMFLNYFMVRKVMAGKELMQAAGTVTRRLGSWLGERRYLDNTASSELTVRGGEASRDLPATRELMNMLDRCVDPLPAHAPQVLEDHFQVDRVEGSRVHLSPMMSDEAVVITLPPPVGGLPAGLDNRRHDRPRPRPLAARRGLERVPLTAAFLPPGSGCRRLREYAAENRAVPVSSALRTLLDAYVVGAG